MSLSALKYSTWQRGQIWRQFNNFDSNSNSIGNIIMKFGWFEDNMVVYMLTDFGIDPINITRDRIFRSMSAGMHHIKF